MAVFLCKQASYMFVEDANCLLYWKALILKKLQLKFAIVTYIQILLI